MPGLNPEREDEQAAMRVVAAIKAAVPTSRHAEMVVDAVLSTMGDDAVVETADERRLVRVFKRDPDHSDWIIPWPILQFVRGRRLNYIMGVGAEGPPTDEAPPARDAPPLRLGGLTPGEFEVSDGFFHISATYGQDGRSAETSRGGSPDTFMSFARAVARGDRNAAEVLIDYLVALDPGRAGPGRLFRPLLCSMNVEGTWVCGLSPLRDAMLDGRVPGSARWVAADGYVGTVVCPGATRADVTDRCREEIRRVKPRRPEPQPPPTLSPETLASFGEHGGPFLITAPGLDGPRVEPLPENTPILLLPLAPLPEAPPPFGEWLRLVDDRGVTSHAILRRDGARGLTIVSEAALRHVDPETLDAVLDTADREAAERAHQFRALEWPPELPRLDSVAVTYAIEERVPGVIFASAHASSSTHGFGGNAIRPEGLGSGVFRQRWVR